MRRRSNEPRASSASMLPDVAFAPREDRLPVEAAPVAEAGSRRSCGRASAEAARRSAATEAAAAEARDAASAAMQRRRKRRLAEAAAAPETPAAPEMVEVWRPGGRPEERRPRHDRNRHQGHKATVRRMARSPPRRRAKPAPAKSASIIVAAVATTNSANPAPMRRPLPRAGAPADGAPAAEARPERGRTIATTVAVRRASASTAREKGDRPKFRVSKRKTVTATRAIATRVIAAAAISAGATRAAATRRQRPVASAMGDQRRAARARSSGRSEFAVCQTGGAQGAARRRPQGLD